MSADQLSKEESDALVRRYVAVGGDTQSLMRLYDDTADQYDKALSTSQYHGPAVLAARVAALPVSKDAQIIDVGAGSGMSGQELKKAGFSCIDALDGSQGMLDVAKEKNVYRHLICALVGGDAELPVPRGSYDLAVSAGAFQQNHLPKTALKSMAEMVKRGGYVVNVMRDTTPHLDYYGEGGLEAYMATLEAQGLWRLEKRELNFKHIGSGSGSQGGVAYIHKVL